MDDGFTYDAEPVVHIRAILRQISSRRCGIGAIRECAYMRVRVV